ncbi:tRNA-uridine aminocarboxypropyltransferase 1 isoform X1 [Callithrix jacchus]|uniref:tRNA-uridine aminocarboxypropyltransferase 1 n=1 Tax=Callithrix jacchus TaxID=9483 RepID=F7IKY2_CALJA|nr:tRNA-uridine aminocarboxypropyltransferase 1 isoform X1 [Callithrix jacchus]XP_035115515.2 tRNA-uridine aminocarboxypropyltransferase 1 isoform X1 [Callithrix jacchus]XP_035115516.2 tRNA-uridine aminocarboxypropyltransferase 1 isoform X1 [Callithrix jacchus]XP_035115517.2 tRNA-uridine aminocarboxypropyltransferase 1 isoform X1 [Callithrix jacchus]XP_035115519.2 tRNA-uridine aminocarboxypropyltransferase 1 isoform X1 [Callithrix jacchus]XP_035115520.2 tRNA-uridine aminocarboxypropyltransfera
MSLNPPIFLKRSEENNSKCVETKQSQTTSIASEDPLKNLCLASQEVLQKAQQSGRSKCLKCGSSRMFYCYTCYVPVENVPIERIPLVKLPLKIDIIKHPNETDGKSTAIHAKLLAPEFVNIYTYPCIPEYEEKDHEVALVFPGPQSISIKDISFHLQKRIQNNIRGKNDDPDKPSFKRKRAEEHEFCDLNDSKYKGTTLKKIVFIDSTWNQTNKIITDERLQGLLQVELKTRKTCFWRHQKGKPDTFLSTIEAIYYFLVDYHTDILKEKYRGQYDNLLFFYSFMYQLIKNAKCSGDKETGKLIH